MTSDLFAGASLFNLRNQRPPMSHTSDVVKKKGGKKEEESADLAPKSWSAPTESVLARRRLSGHLLHLPHTAPPPTTFIILFYCWRPLSPTFFSPPFPPRLHPLRAGRIGFNCIVYDRCRVRFGPNSRQTVQRHFMVSFHLTCWCVVGTRLTKNIHGGGLGGERDWKRAETTPVFRPP